MPKVMWAMIGKLVPQLPKVVTSTYDLHFRCLIACWKGIFVVLGHHVLGHHVSSKGIKVDPTKIEVIIILPPPKTPKEVRRFIGHVGYYRRFIENFTNISAPMFGLLIKDVDFVWTEQCQTAIETLKAKLSMALVLEERGPTFLFHLFHKQELVPCRVKLHYYPEGILGSCSCY
jgi:hypothetical protein